MPTDPLTIALPDQIASARLHMRIPQPGDGPAFFDAVAETRDQLAPWFRWIQRVNSAADAEQFLRQKLAQFHRREYLTYLLIRRDDAALAGTIVLHHLDWDTPAFEIGYWLRTNAQGQGFITEAVQTMTAFCFTTLHAARVQIPYDTRNERSAAVAARCGYSYEATCRRVRRGAQDEICDLTMTSLIRSEWTAQHR
jgi:ribosomal-protein-serine acetyltransferase